MNQQLLGLVIEEVPELIAFIRVAFRKRHPEDPVPTSAEIVAAYQSALLSSLTKDADWLAAHPEST